MAFTGEIPQRTDTGPDTVQLLHELSGGGDWKYPHQVWWHNLSSEVEMSEGKVILQRNLHWLKRWVSKSSVKFSEVPSPAPRWESQRQVQDGIYVVVENPYGKGPGSPGGKQADHELAVCICSESVSQDMVVWALGDRGETANCLAVTTVRRKIPDTEGNKAQISATTIETKTKPQKTSETMLAEIEK